MRNTEPTHEERSTFIFVGLDIRGEKRKEEHSIRKKITCTRRAQLKISSRMRYPNKASHYTTPLTSCRYPGLARTHDEKTYPRVQGTSRKVEKNVSLNTPTNQTRDKAGTNKLKHQQQLLSVQQNSSLLYASK